MRKHFLLTVLVSLLATATFAAVGPQSVCVTFNDTDNADWDVNSPGSKVSVNKEGNGLFEAKMGLSGESYRGDFQYTASTTTYTFNKEKDVVLAIRLTAAIPGGAVKKMEFWYKNTSNESTLIGRFDGPSATVDCADGGKIYCFNLSSKTDQWNAVQSGDVVIDKIQFIFADATGLTDETDKYYVDWVGTFSTEDDVRAFKEWKDEQSDYTKPYYEVLYRSNSGNTGYDNNYPKNGFEQEEFEANYRGGIFAVEYFLIEDFSIDKEYTLTLTNTNVGNKDDLLIWDIGNNQVTHKTAASDVFSLVESISGLAPRATSGEFKTPIATVQSSGNPATWVFTIPARQLTKIATHRNKALVGVLLINKTIGSDTKAKYASNSHASVAKPTFTFSGNYIDTIVNITKQTFEPTIRTAIANSRAGDVIMMRKNDTIKDTRITINHALTIQGATAEITIESHVPANTILFLANDNSSNYTVTFKNLKIDGRNTERSTQLFDANNKATLCMEDVNIVNTQYTGKIADIKSNNNPLILKGSNSFATGVALNRYKFIKHEGATHTSEHPIHLILANDYDDNCKVVEGCNTPALYTAEDAKAEKTWTLVADGFDLKTHRTGAITYDLEVKAAAEGKSTLVLGFDAPLPNGVKAYRLELHNEEIYAYEESSIQARKPVLIVAATGHYTFTSAEDATLDESTATEARYGDLIGNFQLSNKKVPACGDGVYNYILTKKDNVVGFFQVGDATNAIAKNRAYLSCNYDVNESVTPGAPERSMRIVFQESTTTNIDNATLDAKSEKVLINGTIYIRKAEHLYRIDGQLVK